MENDNFIKIDLHIHTPASSCYKGKKNDEEYLRILENCKSKGLRIIAITDHNSIEGYKSLIRIKARLTDEKKSLAAITDSKQAKSRLEIIEKELDLFETILMLAGIEFEVSNGVHILVIFNDNTPIDQVNKFLIDGGYVPDNFGTEDTPVLSNWDIFRLFEESTKYDCILIDAHTDSNKGIYSTIPPGKARASCFRSPQLSGVCYKNEEQKEKLKGILSSPDYFRPTRLPFFKFSDAHIADDVGKPLSWVKLEKASFSSLKSALTNPDETVSTEEPSVSRILDGLLKSKDSFGIPDLSPESIYNFKKHICALANTEGGHILLGVTAQKTILGVEIPDEKDKPKNSFISQFVDCFTSLEPSPRPSVNEYPLQNKKSILSIRITKAPTLVNIKNEDLIYSVKNNSIVTLNGSAIERIVEDKVLKDVELKINRRLESVQNDCHLIKTVFSSLPLMRRFENNSFVARFQMALTKSISLDTDNMGKLLGAASKHPNGTSKGTIFFLLDVQPPRLPFAYLRYTLPLFNVHSLKQTSTSKETLYIVPGGAIYYSKRDYPFFSERLDNILKITADSLPRKLSTKFVVSFLKSSFNFWYLKNKYDEIDLYSPDIFYGLRLPILNSKKPDVVRSLNAIEVNLDNIVKLENDLLTRIRKIKKEDTGKDIEEHNLKVSEFAYDIDKLIYGLLGLTEDDILAIEENLRLNEIYLPKQLKK